MKNIHSYAETGCGRDHECNYAHDAKVDREWLDRQIGGGHYVVRETWTNDWGDGVRVVHADLRLRFDGQRYPGVPIHLMVWRDS